MQKFRNLNVLLSLWGFRLRSPIKDSCPSTPLPVVPFAASSSAESRKILKICSVASSQFLVFYLSRTTDRFRPTQNMIDHRTVVERSYQNDHVRRMIIHRSYSNRSYGYGKRSRAIDRQTFGSKKIARNRSYNVRQRTFGGERQLIVFRTIL